MKVLFISQIVPYPPHGGVLQRGFNLIRELGSRVDLHLVAFNHPDILCSEAQIAESKRVLSPYCRSITYFELRTKRSSLYKWAAVIAGVVDRRPFSAIAHESVDLEDYIRELLEKEDIDVIHYDTIGLAHYRKLAPEIPSVLTHHNIESQLMARRSRNERWPRNFYASLQAKKLLRYESDQCVKFDANVVVSAIDERVLKENVPGLHTVVVPNGVDVDYFRPGTETAGHSVVWAGGMNMFANSDAVMHFTRSIWPIIVDAQPDAVFHIVGQDPPAELVEMAKHDTSLKIHGFVDDVRPIIQQASVYVVPIRVGGGTRLKVLDALASGKAIVSTSVGCEGIDVVDGLNIRIADDTRSFASTVLELFSSGTDRQQLGRQARHLAEASYSWRPIAARLVDAYQYISKKPAQITLEHRGRSV